MENKLLNDKIRQQGTNEDYELPSYSLEKKKGLHIPKKLLIALVAVGTLLAAIYIPPLLLKETDNTSHKSVTVTGKPAALQEFSIYRSNNPQMDFDDDGLVNELEYNQTNTKAYSVDTDGDGTTDYAEINLTGTNPCVYDDAVVNFIKERDNKTGGAYNTPFKDGEVTMWADDYESKARGSAIETYQDTYLFSKFNGYVEFPEGVVAAYEVRCGHQYPLSQNQQGYYHINAKEKDVYIRVHHEQPAECGCLTVFGKEIKMESGYRFLSAILPSSGKGIITCKNVLAEDFDNVLEEKTTKNEFKSCNTNLLVLSEERFSRNYNQKQDLNTILEHLKNNENVIISMISGNSGEAVMEVYGYTSYNNLLVCDPMTGEDYGILAVTLRSSRLLDKTNDIARYEYFDFNGCGYSLANKDRITIIGFIGEDGEVQYLNGTPSEPDDPNENPDDPNKQENPDDPNKQENPDDPNGQEDPQKPPKQEMTREEQIHAAVYPEGFEEKVTYAAEDGTKIHRVLRNVSLADFVKYTDTLRSELGFDCYYSEECTTNAIYCLTVCDKDQNIIFVKYELENRHMLVRYESAEAAHEWVDEATGYQMMLKPGYFLEELTPKAIADQPVENEPVNETTNP